MKLFFLKKLLSYCLLGLLCCTFMLKQFVFLGFPAIFISSVALAYVDVWEIRAEGISRNEVFHTGSRKALAGLLIFIVLYLSVFFLPLGK